MYTSWNHFYEIKEYLTLFSLMIVVLKTQVKVINFALFFLNVTYM